LPGRHARLLILATCFARFLHVVVPLLATEGARHLEAQHCARRSVAPETHGHPMWRKHMGQGRRVQSSETIPAFPRHGDYGLYVLSPGGIGVFFHRPPCQHQAVRIEPTVAAPRNHTTFAVRCERFATDRRTHALRRSVPSQPAPRFFVTPPEASSWRSRADGTPVPSDLPVRRKRQPRYFPVHEYRENGKNQRRARRSGPGRTTMPLTMMAQVTAAEVRRVRPVQPRKASAFAVPGFKPASRCAPMAVT